MKTRGQLLSIRTILLVALVLCWNLESSHAQGLLSPWTWVCREQVCVKIEKTEIRKGENGVPVGVCKLNCGHYGRLLPRPAGQVEIGSQYFHFQPQNVEFSSLQPENVGFEDLYKGAQQIFRDNLSKAKVYTEAHGNVASRVQAQSGVDANAKAVATNKLMVTMTGVWKPNRVFTLTAPHTDESYSLSSSYTQDNATVSVTITASTFYGARHGLETLNQLITFDEDANSFVTMQKANITDSPVYPYRGVMLDTSRNFYSVPSIKRIIDGMSLSKLNVFHWHITDTHSFPFFSKREPKLTQYGAYSQREVYSIADMQDIVSYARVRGVKVLPEFDQPAHVGNGWQWGQAAGLGDLAICINKEPWQRYCVEPPCGQLNVVNENLFPILGNLYKDFLDIFDKDIFHMGGDEINYNCWNSSTEIRDWLKKEGKDLSQESFIDLWGWFQNRAYQKLEEANGGSPITSILWTSDITDEKYIEKYLDNKRYIVQIWSKSDDSSIASLIDRNYRVIFANYDAWYLDCGYGGWVGAGPNNWCSPYKGWQQIYENNPIQIYAKLANFTKAEQAFKNGLILGGSVQLWSEQADEESSDSKIWPRAAAFAERLWTNPSGTWEQAEYRMVQMRQLLVERGIHADRLQPQWCNHNEGLCYLNLNSS